jgi:signal transduction histidine kinase/CheY-like chemotaxis protein
VAWFGLSVVVPGAKRLAVAVVVSFGLLLAAAAAAIVLANQAADAERWVTHTLEVRRLNQALLGRVQDATLGERGFVITEDRRYLGQFEAAKADAPRLETRLRDLTRDNGRAHARIENLHRAIQAQMGELDRTVGLLQRGRRDEAIAAVRSHLVVNRLEDVRAATAAIEDAEVRLLAAREARVTASRALLVGAVAICLIAAMMLALFVVRAGRRAVGELEQRSVALADEMLRREASEGQLRQAQKMEALGQLTGGLAHDLNNMLAIIIGNLDMLARRLTDDEARRRFVDQALEGAQRAARLTQSLLAFSRQQPLAPKPLDVNRTVAEMSRILRSTLGEQITIETVLAGGLWPALIDQSQLESAALNLAINARDAMPNGGKLTIETANAFLDEAYARSDASVAPGPYVLLALTDTGAGMPAQVVEKAFDPFFTTKAVGHGTGLGLSQVHGFVKQSGGHVKIYSEPGRGTTVKLYLPRSRALAGAPGESAEPAPQDAAAGTWVLVVEDEAAVREFASNALRDLGYCTREAADGSAALELLQAHPEIELLLTDVVMPGMSGRQLGEQALALRPDLKVLYMTGYTRNAIVHNGVLDRDARLLTKPFTLSLLAGKVREALGA